MNGAAGIPSGEILFLRVAPPGVVRPLKVSGSKRPNRLRAAFAPNGARGRAMQRPITSFWIGLGRGVRIPGRELLDRLRQGAVEEIVDIGCAGALDPALTRGDLVLSSDDLVFDAAAPLSVRRRAGIVPLLQEVAARRGVGLKVAPILTHERFIADRSARIELFERTGCAAVQMEHAWFLQRLQPLLPAGRFEQLRVTHLVLITDAVPHSDSRRASARSVRDALAGYLLPGCGAGISSLRREVLNSWPEAL
jgi:hypothetical protein